MKYIINYEYITEVLCKNKDKPGLEFIGQYYLMKSLAEEARKELPGEREP